MKKSLKPTTSLFPVPAVMVTCTDKEGNHNIITIAWVGTINSTPPMIGIGVRPNRHSYTMIKETGEFVINIPTLELAKVTDYCGVVSGSNIDKFKETGLTAIPAKKVQAPLIKECPVSLECVVKDIAQLGSHDYFMAEIVSVTVDESVANGEVLDKSKINSFAYLNGSYVALGERIADMGFSLKEQE